MEQPVVGLVVHPTKNVQESVATLQRWNASGQGRLVARRSDAQRLGGGVDVVEEDDFTEQIDLVVALGGDGTMLGAMRLVAKRPVPVNIIAVGGNVDHDQLGAIAQVTGGSVSTVQNGNGVDAALAQLLSTPS